MERDRLSRDLSERLIDARMTAEALSLRAQLARDTVGRWIRGTTVPSLAALRAVEGVLSNRLGYEVNLSEAVRERHSGRQGDRRPVLPSPRPELVNLQSHVMAAPEVRYSLPPDAAAFTGRGEELEPDHRCGGGRGRGWRGGGDPRDRTGCRGWARPRWRCTRRTMLREQFPDRQLFIDLHAHTPGQEPVSAGGRRWPGCWPRPGWIPVPARGPGRAGGAVAGPDGRAAGAAGAGQRRQQQPGRPAAARRMRLPGAGDQPPAPGRPARRGGAGRCWMSCRRSRRRRCSPGWRPARWTAQPGVAEVVRLAGFLPLAISLLARVYARHPSWTLADLAAETQDGPAHPDGGERQRRRRVRGVLPAPGPGSAAVLPPAGPAPGRHHRRLRRRGAGRNQPGRGGRDCWTACTARAC